MHVLQETATVIGERKDASKEISQRIEQGWQVSSSSARDPDRVQITFTRDTPEPAKAK